MKKHCVIFRNIVFTRKMWPEISQARAENRHELILSGGEISQRLLQEGLDPNLFKLIGLNLLRISETTLDSLQNEIANLVNLQSLLLHSNKISTITAKICDLSKLKMLDLSRNELTIFPAEIGKLSQLTSLNLSSNQLQQFPNLSQNVRLSVLDLSHNKLEEFPDICHSELALLSEVKLNSNCITSIPDELNVLPALKILDLSVNKVTMIPGELSDCLKLKEVNFKENPITDKRLYKLIDQCRSKQVLDYVRQNCPRKTSGGAGKNKKGGKKAKKGEQKPSEVDTEQNNSETSVIQDLSVAMHRLVINKLPEEQPTLNIRILDSVKAVRPHILACIIKNVKFTDDTFRPFIQIQTKLHDTVCEKRNSATIATHDLNKLPQNEDLTYTACPPNDLVIRPLNRANTCTGAKLFDQLRTEADNLRREKKRNTYSGIHRFLYLLEGKALYPCLLDSGSKVISFPPITNSEDTKITLETTSILIEVTSATGQEVCKRVLDMILKEMIELGIGEKADDGVHNCLTVQKVKIVDIDGNLKAVYPSRADLNFEKSQILVVRE